MPLEIQGLLLSRVRVTFANIRHLPYPYLRLSILHICGGDWTTTSKISLNAFYSLVI